MESFTELLTDAFPETLGPSFAGEDLDFENLNLPDEAANVRRQDGALIQEATGESAAFGEEAEDVSYVPEKVYKEHADEESGEEDPRSGGVRLMVPDGVSQEDYTGSEGECDEEEEEPGELLASVRCSDEVCEKEDGIFAEGRPLAPQSVGNPQVSNEEQGEAGCDEELSYFGRAPEKGSETVVKSGASAEDERESDTDEQELSSHPVGGGVKAIPEEREAHRPRGPHPASAGLDFHRLSLHNLLDLITDVDGEERVDKMKEFTGEEHQEAGESFADYPSDFSSCEDGARDQESDGKADASVGPRDRSSNSQTSRRLERDEPDVTRSGTTETPEDDEEEDAAGSEGPDVTGSAGSREVVEVDGEETGESDSYSSSNDDDDVDMRRSSSRETSGDWGFQDPKSRTRPEDGWLDGGSRTKSGERLMSSGGADAAHFLSWDDREFEADRRLSGCFWTTDGTQATGTHTPGVKRRHTDDGLSSPMVERDNLKSSSSQGSLGYSVLLDAGGGPPGVAGEGSNQYEEERNWEHEQERIKAFYDYYDDSDEEDEREGRPTKVQFCADPLSQIIHYESDSDSLSSSTDRDDDRSSADTSDELVERGDPRRPNPDSDPRPAELQDGAPDAGDPRVHARRGVGLGSMKLLLKMSLATAAGLLMLWLAADEADWLHRVSVFWGSSSSFHR